MKREIVGSLGVFVGLFLLAAFLPGQANAEEGAFNLSSCGGWVNCNTQSPNYTGICCRVCRDPEKGNEWECMRVGGETEQLGAAPTANVPTGEATITGIITREGLLQTEQGQDYAVAGTEATRLKDNMGKEIEVKGTVQEADGKATVDVTSYQMMDVGPAVAIEKGASCGAWLNCDSRPPTFTGTCCRQCPDEKGQQFWDCKAFSVGEHFDLAEWANKPR